MSKPAKRKRSPPCASRPFHGTDRSGSRRMAATPWCRNWSGKAAKSTSSRSVDQGSSAGLICLTILETICLRLSLSGGGLALRSFLTLALLCALGTAEARDRHDWQSLALLKAGDRIYLSLKSGPVEGTFQSWTVD